MYLYESARLQVVPLFSISGTYGRTSETHKWEREKCLKRLLMFCESVGTKNGAQTSVVLFFFFNLKFGSTSDRQNQKIGISSRVC